MIIIKTIVGFITLVLALLITLGIVYMGVAGTKRLGKSKLGGIVNLIGIFLLFIEGLMWKIAHLFIIICILVISFGVGDWLIILLFS